MPVGAEMLPIGIPTAVSQVASQTHWQACFSTPRFLTSPEILLHRCCKNAAWSALQPATSVGSG
eukprot:scaffold1435_cov267-Pinguiococcus_pyrenoidosus.AAC.49